MTAKKFEDLLFFGSFGLLTILAMSYLFYDEMRPLFVTADIILRLAGVTVTVIGAVVAMDFVRRAGHNATMRKIEAVNSLTFFEKLSPGEIALSNRADVIEYANSFYEVGKGGGLLDAQGGQFYAVPTISKVAPPLLTDQPTDPISLIKRGDWLESFVLNGRDEPNFNHLQLCGPTGKGKTTLALAVVSLLQKPLTQAEYYLSDPKWEGPFSGWPFQPQCIEFDDAPKFAEFLYNDVYTPRKMSVRGGKRPQFPAFGLFDELDGCFDEHNGTFINPVKRVLKEGRHTKTHAILIGQSPLAKDCGLNTADMRQCARIVLDIEALTYLTSSGFPYRSDKENKDAWLIQLKHLLENGLRGALVIPSSGAPFIAEIPTIDIESLSFQNLAGPDVTATIKEKVMTDKEKKLVEMARNGESLRAMARFWYDTENVGGYQCQVVRDKLKSFGIDV